jgi:hypothetical protein
MRAQTSLWAKYRIMMALAAFLAGAAAGPDLLAQRRTVMQARWRGAYSATV